MSTEIKLITTEAIANQPVEKTVHELTSLLKEGFAEPAHLAAFFKKVSIINEELNKDKELKELFYDKTREYIQGGYDKLCGLKVQIATVATSYDYTDCNHVELNELLNIQEAIALRIKSIQKELQDMAKDSEKAYAKGDLFGVPSNTKTVVIEHMPVLSCAPSGEVCTISPPIKKSIMGLKYFKK